MNCCRRRRQPRFAPEPVFEEGVGRNEQVTEDANSHAVAAADWLPEERPHQNVCWSNVRGEPKTAEKSAAEPSLSDFVTIRFFISGLDLLALDTQQRRSLKVNMIGEIMCIVGDHIQVVQDIHGVGPSLSVAYGAEVAEVPFVEFCRHKIAADEPALVVAGRLQFREPRSSGLEALSSALSGEAAIRQLAGAVERALPLATCPRMVNVEVTIQTECSPASFGPVRSCGDGAQIADIPRTTQRPHSPRFHCALDLPKPSLALPRGKLAGFDFLSAERFGVVEFATLQEPAPSIWSALVEFCCASKQDPSFLCSHAPARDFTLPPVQDDCSSSSRMSL